MHVRWMDRETSVEERGLVERRYGLARTGGERA
jgi:hypothetical protein